MSKPLILEYYEFDKTQHNKFLLSKKKETFKLKCKYCPKEISAAIDITSNWVTHLKTKHLDRHNEYEQKKNKEVVMKILNYLFFDFY